MGTKSKPQRPGDSAGTSRVVPMGSFVDPNWPEASGASVNYGHDRFESVDEHPLVHNPAFAQTAGGLGAALAQEQEGGGDRADWKKDDWKTLAGEYELSTSGTVDELKARVAEHEAALESDASGDTEPPKEGDQ